ncbi:MAG: glycosyl hydrolase family 18 protein [Pseudomonadota bacterium]
MKRFWILSLAGWIGLLAGTASAAGNFGGWITAYWMRSSVWDVPPKNIDFSKMTHIVHFTTEPTQTAPYYTVQDMELDNDGSGVSDQVELLNYAHAGGVKVLLCLGGVGGDWDVNMTYVTSTDGLATTYVNNVLSYAKSKGYDGVDIDWEVPDTADLQNFIRLMTKLRAGLDAWQDATHPKGILTIAVPTWATRKGYDVPTLNATADQVNLMTYDMEKDFDYIGFNSAIRKPTTYPNYDAYDIDYRYLKGPDGWITKGLLRSRIGIGLPFYGHRCNGNTAPGQTRICSSWSDVKYEAALALKNESGSVSNWDSEAQVPWIGNNASNYFITYDDKASIAAKVNYTRTETLGGVMIWELWYDTIKAGGKPYTHPLLDAAAAAYQADPPPPDTTLPSVTIDSPANNTTTNASSIAVSGTASDNVALSSVQVRVNGSAWQNASGTGSWSFTASLAVGVNSIDVQAIDTSNNLSTIRTVNVTRSSDPPPPDTTSPTVAIGSPANNATTTGTSISVTGTASDNVGVTLVAVRVNGGSWQNVNGTSAWSASISVALGSNSIEAQASDAAGNKSTIPLVNVTRSPASYELVYSLSANRSNPIPLGGATLEPGRAVYVFVTSVTGITKVSFRLDGGFVRDENYTPWDFQGGETTAANPWIPSPGNHEISGTVTASSASNVSASFTVSASPPPADTVAPTVSIASVPATTDRSSLVVTGSASDNRELRSVSVRVNGGAWQIASGTSSWSATVLLSAGENLIEARAVDASDNLSVLAQARITFALGNFVVQEDPTPTPSPKAVVSSGGCSVPSSAASGPWWILVPLLGLLQRRMKQI